MFLLNFCLADPSTQWREKLPGRVGASLHHLDLGNTVIFFYLSESKNKIIQELVSEVDGERIYLAPEVNVFETVTKEITPLASRFPKEEKIPADRCEDSLGNSLLNRFRSALRDVIRSELNFHELFGVSRELNFILNQDAHNFHKDQSLFQFKLLSSGKLPTSQSFHIFQDLTLIDWDMSPGTLSGTIFQDPLSDDRFIIPLFPKENVGMIFAEHTEALDSTYHSEYGFPTIFPFHAVLSPIDFYPHISFGSSKGKRLSSVLRGVVATKNIENLRKQSSEIHLPRYALGKQTDDAERSYSNEIVSFTFHQNFVKQIKKFMRFNQLQMDNYFVTNSRLECMKLAKTQNASITDFLEIQLNHRVENKKIDDIYFIKKPAEGFSSLEELKDCFPKDADLLLINITESPFDHSLYQLSQDLTKIGYPLIRLIHTPLDRVFHVKSNALHSLHFTPSEEIIHRPIGHEGNHTQDRLPARIDQKFLIINFVKE